MASKRPSIAMGGGAVLAGCLVAAVLLEIAGLVLWRQPWYDAMVTEQLNPRKFYRRNLLGLRGEDPVTPKPEGLQRVLFLGDSFTFGSGVTDDAAIFPAQVERLLNERRSDTGSFEVQNGGLPGSQTGDWVELWERVRDVLEPDLVVLVFFIRDGAPISMAGFFPRIRVDIAERNLRSPLYRWSHGFRLVRDQLDRLRVAREYAGLYHDFYLGDVVDTAEWSKARRNIVKIQRDASNRRIRVGFVVFPVLVELNAGHPFRDVVGEILNFSRSVPLPTLDLLPFFEGRDATQLWVSPMDQHPNAEAHGIVARALLPFIEELLEQEPPEIPRER